MLQSVAVKIKLAVPPAVPLKLKKLPEANWTYCSHLQWKFKEISWA